MASYTVSVRLMADTSDLEEALKRIVEAIGLPPEIEIDASGDLEREFGSGNARRSEWGNSEPATPSQEDE
jgi:hypothetical protein